MGQCYVTPLTRDDAGTDQAEGEGHGKVRRSIKLLNIIKNKSTFKHTNNNRICSGSVGSVHRSVCDLVLRSYLPEAYHGLEVVGRPTSSQILKKKGEKKTILCF